MKIDVKDLKTEVGGRLRRHFAERIAPLEVDGEEAAFPEPVEVDAELLNTGEGIHAHVRVRAQAELHCGRCLEPFRLTLKSEFREVFREEGESELEDEGDERGPLVSDYDGETIDLTEPVRENLFLAVPMKPLCREDCPGLCPRCGKNLKDGPCGCEDVPVDPRLAVLKDLFKGGSEGPL